MTNKTWYTDGYARQKHLQIESFVKPMSEQLFPDHLFTHCGFNRNEETNEITIRLHLRPIGEARLISDRLNSSHFERLG